MSFYGAAFFSVTALETHFGIHLDSDESDLVMLSDDEWTDDGKQ